MSFKDALTKIVENMRKSDPERLQRLEDLGYDTSKVYFHGGPGDIKEFKPTAPTLQYSDEKLAGHTDATYFSEDPRYSSNFAMSNSDSTVYPVFLNKSGVFDPDNRSHLSKVWRESPHHWQSMTIEELKSLGPLDENWAQIEGIGDSINKSGFSGMKLRENFRPNYELNNQFEIANNIGIFKPEENVKSIWAKGLSKKGLMSGAVAAEMDPLKKIGDLVNVYRTNQEKVADAITKQVTQPFGEADELQKTMMRFALDPLNLVEGPAAIGLTAAEMMARKTEAK